MRKLIPVAVCLMFIGGLFLVGCQQSASKENPVASKAGAAADSKQTPNARPANASKKSTSVEANRADPVASKQPDSKPAEVGLVAPAAAVEPAEQPAAPEQPGRHGHPRLPPEHFIKTNGPIFQDWPKPEVLLVFTGQQLGYLEPCGCAGLNNQKGGLSRRHTMLRQLRGDGWRVVPMDLGGQIRYFGTQAEMKYGYTLESLVELGYRAVGLGAEDLRQPAEQIFLVASELSTEQNPFVASNVGVLDFGLEEFPAYRIVEEGGRRIGIAAILGKRQQAEIRSGGIVFRDPAEALAEVLPQLREKADFVVLLSYAEKDESAELLKQFPEFDLVVTAGGAKDPPSQPTYLEGSTTPIVEVGKKGMYAVAVGLYDEPDQMRYQRVPLDGRFDDSPEMLEMMVRYQDELKQRGLAGLGLKPQPHPSAGKFAGTETCAQCHTKAHEVWEQTPHAHATQTLIDLDPPRHHDPECLACHVTGWEPQRYFPFISGYLNLEKSAHLRANGCENCHGPAAKHAAAQLGEIELSEEEATEVLRRLRLPLEKPEKGISVAEANCRACHDEDNSPDFNFEQYWPQVAHEGKD